MTHAVPMKRARAKHIDPAPKGTAPARTVADVARMVAGTDPPPWLAEYFTRWAPCVTLDCHVGKRQPTRTAMKKRLADVRAAALLLRCALSDAPTMEFLGVGGPLENTSALGRRLLDLAQRAEHAAESDVLSTKAGKTKAGRSKALLPGVIPARLFCAALIAEAWAFLRNEEPPPRNRDAADAAEVYWQISVGARTGQGGVDPLNGWRPYFDQARDPSMAKTRAELRRHLVEAARYG